MSRRSFSHGPREKATAAYESSTVRKMRATPWQSMDGNARDRCVFWPVHSLYTDHTNISFLPLVQEVRAVCKTHNQLPDIPATYPATIVTVGGGAEVRRRVHLAWASTGGDEHRGRARGGSRGLCRSLTGSTRGLVGETRKRLRGAQALWGWLARLGW